MLALYRSGPPGRGARGLPGGAQRPRRGARDRAGPRAARARGRRSCARTRCSSAGGRRHGAPSASRVASSWDASESWAASTAALEDAVAGRGGLVPAGGRARHRQEPAGRGAQRSTRGRAGRACSSAAAGRPAARPPTGRGSSRCAPTSVTPSPRRCGRSSASAPAISPSSFPSCASSSPTSRSRRRSSRRVRASACSTPRARSCERAARRSPLVLVLDDLHAADDSLAAPPAVRRPRASPTAGCSSSAPTGTSIPTLREPLAPTLAELVREPPTHQISLAGLSEADVADYIELSTSVEPAPASWSRRSTARPRETPSSSPRSVRLLDAEGRLGDGRCPPPHPAERPGRDRAARGATVRSVPRASSCSASVLGREFGLDALARLSELPPRRAPGRPRRGDDRARRRRGAWLARAAAVRPRADPRHALRRADPGPPAAAAPRGRRSARDRLRRRPASLTSPSWRSTSSPRRRPDGATRRSSYARRAGDRAASQLAYEEAVRLYEMALTLVDGAGRALRPAARARGRAGEGRRHRGLEGRLSRGRRACRRRGSGRAPGPGGARLRRPDDVGGLARRRRSGAAARAGPRRPRRGGQHPAGPAARPPGGRPAARCRFPPERQGCAEPGRPSRWRGGSATRRPWPTRSTATSSATTRPTTRASSSSCGRELVEVATEIGRQGTSRGGARGAPGLRYVELGDIAAAERELAADDEAGARAAPALAGLARARLPRAARPAARASWTRRSAADPGRARAWASER